MKQPDLFISHSSADSEAVEILVADLEKAGLTCWLGPRDVSFGGAYQAEIVDAIDQCRALLLVFSTAANKSEHVLREIELAVQGKKPIYPLRIDRSEPVGGLKYLLANKQWVDRKPLGDRLPETIARLLKGATPPRTVKETDDAPARSPRPLSRATRPVAMAGAGLLALALVIASVWMIQGGLLSSSRPGESTSSKRGVAASENLVIAAVPVVPEPAPAAPKPASVAPEVAAPQPPPAAPVPAAPKPAPAVPEIAGPTPAGPAVAAPTPAPAAPEPAAPKPEPVDIAAPKPVPAAPAVAAQTFAPTAPEPAAPRPVPAAQEPAAPVPAPTAPERDIEKPPGLQITSLPPERRPSFEPPPVVLATAPPDGSALGPGVYFFKECDVCPVMAVIPPGRATIGSPDHEPGRNASEGPQQSLVFSRAFAVGQSEVSFEEWFACVAEGGCNAHRPGDYGWGQGKQPVINVSWTDAKAYVEWLSRKTGKPYRLLSEAEWEYAARGCAPVPCASRPFWFGGEISPARANYDWRYSYNASPKAQPPRRTVASDTSDPNPFGLRHVHGNVREWVEDCWNPNLVGLPKDGSARKTGDCNSHVIRGGAWSDEPKDLRAAKRAWEVSNERRAQIGFRVARSLAP